MSEEDLKSKEKPSSATPVENMINWIQQIRNYEAVSWDRMPEIDLYMDQVITYLDRQLSLFQRNDASKLLTSSMVNNYVKDKLLPRPEHKRYAREHLAALLVICLLKQALSIPDIATLSHYLQTDCPIDQLYGDFCQRQKEALNDVCTRVEQAAGEGETALMQLALSFSLEGTARRIAAERILSELAAAKQEQ